MARKIKARLIMQLRDQAMSRREIARTWHMSMESVCEVFNIADERGISWADVEPLPDDEAYRLFYPDRHVGGASTPIPTGSASTPRWRRSA